MPLLIMLLLLGAALFVVYWVIGGILSVTLGQILVLGLVFAAGIAIGRQR